MNFRNVLVALLIGLVAGWLASFIVGGGGSLLKYLVWGILGAFVGSYVRRLGGISLGLRSEVVRDSHHWRGSGGHHCQAYRLIIGRGDAT